MTLTKKQFYISLVILTMLVFPGVCPSRADQTGLLTGKNKTTDKTLHIKADRLVSDRNSLYIIFTGNAQATYEGMTINSDDLKITYLDMPKDQTQLNEGKIDKIIANGHVIIRLDDKTAYCDQAVYTTETKTIVLTGDNVKIDSEGNYINGEKIVIHQLTGQITVDGNAKKRVNAVFTPKTNPTDLSGDKNKNEKK